MRTEAFATDGKLMCNFISRIVWNVFGKNNNLEYNNSWDLGEEKGNIGLDCCRFVQLSEEEKGISVEIS